ncbi:zeta toxin family protein [Campylobacter rectus]|uniref:zeta toxin family protein n=1 Tax=Campylobacter rectus TaxID=203 RepID=UPI0028DC4DB1|nr:zeta toxin family protein [Campylobacter rectus]
MKRLYVFAGVNGAGKSTFYVRQLEDDKIYGLRINSDELVREFGDWRNAKDQRRAARLALRLRKNYLENGVSFNIETTLSGHSIVNFIKDAKARGYFVTLFYVGLDSVELSKRRVAIRAAKNGQAVLERRYDASFVNLAQLIGVCDEIYFYDNSAPIENEDEQKFSNLALVAKKQDGCVTRISEERYEWFERVMREAEIAC